MAIAFRASMEGDRELKARLERIAGAGDKGIRKEARVAAKHVAEEEALPLLRENTPIKTGALRGSEKVKVAVSQKREDIRLTLIAGGADAPYARIVESRQHYMVNSLMQLAHTALASIGARMDIEKAAE